VSDEAYTAFQVGCLLGFFCGIVATAWAMVSFGRIMVTLAREWEARREREQKARDAVQAIRGSLNDED
jgi:hypothetical protein